MGLLSTRAGLLCVFTFERTPVRLSTRNQLPATVTSITLGDAMATVKVTVEGGHSMTA